jgi:SOS-response transcriptional repressor LexA
MIAQELTQTVRRSATIDWSVKESARANLRRLVRRILRQHGYPPDKSEKATQTVLEQAVLLGFEFAEETPTDRAARPFEVVAERDARPYENSIPLMSLKAAAGAFRDEEASPVEAEAWVRPVGRTKPGPGLFVARVVGESMNRRIPNGSYCVFRHPVEGSRQSRVVLVEHRDIVDPELGGSFTVKVWESDKEESGDGTWRHSEVRLKPDSSDPAHKPIVLRDMDDSEIAVVAELHEVLPGTP